MRSNERFSKYFNLAPSSYYFDFFDIRVNRDTKAFLDPGILRATNNNFADECKNLVQDFFSDFLESVSQNNEEKGLKLLSGLYETNYYHLGLSREKSKGKSTGKELNKKIWDSFQNSKASKTNLLQDIEDSALFIEKIGPDRISDMVCAILREKFAKYTLEVCKKYNLESTMSTADLDCWENGKWINKKFQLPTTEYTPIILIPKFLIRKKTITNHRYFQSNYILDELRRIEINANSELVKIIKARNEPTVYQKDLKKKYGSNKESVVEQTIRYKKSLEKYRSDIRNTPPKTLPLDELSRIMGIPFFNPELLNSELKNIPSSTDFDSAYSLLVDLTFNCLFHAGVVFIESKFENDIPYSKYYSNSSNKLLKYIKESKNITEINAWSLNSTVGEKDLDKFIRWQANNSNSFNIVFCRGSMNLSPIENFIFIKDNDFPEIIYDYKEGILFEENGFFRINLL